MCKTEVCVTSVTTYCFADMSADFLRLVVTAVTLLFLLGRGFSLSVVSFGVAVDMQDVGGAQRPVKQFVCRAAAATQLRLVIAACLLRAQSHNLTFKRLRRADVCCQHTILLFF